MKSLINVLLLFRLHIVESSVIDTESGSALIRLFWIRIRTGDADPCADRGMSKEITNINK
jgi:hypothetical protein